MSASRRRFLKGSAAVAVGFAGLKNCVHTAAADEAGAGEESPNFGYGDLLADPKGILSLPRGFSYRVISEEGREMNDSLLVPGAPDGMAAIDGPYGLTVVIRNHELTPDNTGPFGEERKLAANIPASKLYDAGNGKTPCSGGTSTIVYDTTKQRVVREYMSLAGTIRNCAGGPTPWNTWITCEETTETAGKKENYEIEKDHGYNFEVPVTDRMELADPVPLIDMGRFNHEAVAVDPKTGVVYQTEDRDDGAFYRFLPNHSGKLKAGGRLQVMELVDQRSADTRNWDDTATISVGQKARVRWRDIDQVESPEDDLRTRAFDGGAARFARGEGIWHGKGDFYFACTSGGNAKLGQIWRYTPSPDEGNETAATTHLASLELFIEPNDGELIHNADNLTVSPWGDLIVCEDRSGQIVRLVGVTPNGQCYPFAMNHMRTEFAGATFSPDGTTLFVNIQQAGLTVAITGPWHQKAQTA